MWVRITGDDVLPLGECRHEERGMPLEFTENRDNIGMAVEAKHDDRDGKQCVHLPFDQPFNMLRMRFSAAADQTVRKLTSCSSTDVA